MQNDAKKAYVFRDVDTDDLPLLRDWLSQPHNAEWWDDADEAVEEIREAMDSVETEPLIVEWKGKPIAYLQCYDPHLEEGHPYQDQPFGTLGLDISIGEPELVGVGHGSAIISQFAEQLFEEGCPRVIIDPHPDNVRAIRAYEKAGFHELYRIATIYGDAVLMALDAPAD